MARYVSAHEVLRPGETILLMLSGGADSMALLHLLDALNRTLRLGLQPAALHIDYAARGADSDRDREIVARGCAALAVPLHILRLKRALEGADFQERARVLRYDEARRLVAEHGYDVIVTGHHRDDQAETILYRLTKYASPRGLGGMRPREGALARPLLCLGADEIRAYCDACGIAYGEDVTNLETRYARNLIRLEVLPILRRLNPRVAETLAATAELAAAEAAVLTQATAAALERAVVSDEEGGEALAIAALRAEDPALRALALHAWARAALGSEALVERRMVAALEGLVARPTDDGRVSLGRGLEAVRARGRLSLCAPGAPHACPETVLAGARLSDGPAVLTFCGRRWRVSLEPGPGLCLDPAHPRLGLPQPPARVAFRHPLRAERFAPSGLGAETTVARFLAAARVPREARSRAVILEIDGATAWVGWVPSPDGAVRGRVAEGFLVDQSTLWTVHVDQEAG